jgi:hypothetical protein
VPRAPWVIVGWHSYLLPLPSGSNGTLRLASSAVGVGGRGAAEPGGGLMARSATVSRPASGSGSG